MVYPTHHRMLFCVLVVFLLLICVCPVKATYVFPFHIFTCDGAYHDSPDVDMYVVVSNGTDQVDFTFYNASNIDSSLARIYFDDGSLLTEDAITNGPGTDFSEVYPGPGNLPAGETIGFYADREFSIGAVSPPPKNGVNPVVSPPEEWVKIHFTLVSGGTLEGVVSELYSGELRVGIHIIALPDGSSESAILIPEPATLCLLAAGAIAALRRRNR